MPRKVFFSFHYKPDHWRASQVRNIGVIEKNQLASDNEWEAIARAGDAAIEKWINDQMLDRTCAIVLIGADTAGRKWINYEIVKAWNDGKGLFGIYIHNLKNKDGMQTRKGANPFDAVTFKSGAKFSSAVLVYDPPYKESTNVFLYISDNLKSWVERAITARKR